MADDWFEGLVGTRTHRHRYVDRSTGSPVPQSIERPEPGGNVYMLLEDLRLHALPYGHGTDDGFVVAVDPSSETVSALVLHALPVRGYRHWQLEAAFRDYMESALWFLAQGDMYLEIEYFRSSENPNGSPVAFRLDFLFPELVRRRFGMYRYSIPTRVDEEDDVGWSSEPLDPKCVVVVSLPRRLRRELDRTLQVIRAADQDLQVMSDFTTGRNGSDSGFDLGAYQRLSHDIVLRASRAIGWAGRGLFTDDLLDPERVWRALQFARFGIELRNIALHGLQEAIDRAGIEIGFQAELQLSKVLTVEDVDQLEADLFAGTRPIGEMFVPKIPN